MKIRCNIITSMLMHGENTKVAELRPPAIKGAMRFWWRAIHGNLTLQELKKEESKLFGGAGEDSAVKSSFRIKINSVNLRTKQINPLPHKKGGFTINGYDVNQAFEIEFLGENLDLIKDIFRLSTILGGFGQRSRRGFGSIQINDGWEITEENIQNLIKTINEKFQYTSNVDYPYIVNIDISKYGKDDYNEVLKKIGKATHNHADKCIGSVNPRYASPIYISVIKKENKFFPIVTTLKYKKECREKIEAFKKEILS